MNKALKPCKENYKQSIEGKKWIVITCEYDI